MYYRSIEAANIRCGQNTQFFNPLRPSGYFMYHQVKNLKIVHPTYKLYLCVSLRILEISDHFPKKLLINWFS
jgi:hypothetical protein